MEPGHLWLYSESKASIGSTRHHNTKQNTSKQIHQRGEGQKRKPKSMWRWKKTYFLPKQQLCGEKEEGGGASLELGIRVGKGMIILKC